MRSVAEVSSSLDTELSGVADTPDLWNFQRSSDCQFHSTLLDLTDKRLIDEHA
jgi:hypothetical protein